MNRNKRVGQNPLVGSAIIADKRPNTQRNVRYVIVLVPYNAPEVGQPAFLNLTEDASPDATADLGCVKRRVKLNALDTTPVKEGEFFYSQEAISEFSYP